MRAFWHVVPLAGDGSSEDACEEMEEQVLDAYEAWLYEVENAEAHEPDLAD